MKSSNVEKQGRKKNKMAARFKLEKKHRSLHAETRGKIAPLECLTVDQRGTTPKAANGATK